MLTRRFEVCAYRHCNNEFRPKREAQRFCSETCRKAYHYDTTRASKKRRKRRLKAVCTAANESLGGGILRSVEKNKKRSTKTATYRGGVDPSAVLKSRRPIVDLVGIDPKLLREIIKIECS